MTEAERAARSDAAYKDMRKQLDDALKKDSRLAKIAEKIKAGKANFTDTAEYSDLVAKHLSGVIQNNIGTIKSSAGIRMVCDALLKDHYDSINDVLGQVQTVLDEQNGIHLRPQAAAYPAERVHTLTSSLTDPTVAAQTILRRAGAPVENVAKSMHDDYMEENAKFRSDAGLKCWIVRTTDGKCCSWCTSIAGRYEYGKEPQSVYRRHDNCGCTVTYENGRQRQDVWSKRTWESDQPTPVRVEPTRLTGAQGRETEQRNLSQITRFSHAQGEAVQGRNLRYRGLTSGGGSGIIKNIELPAEIEMIRSMSAETRKAVYDAIEKLQAEYNVHLDAILAKDLGRDSARVPFQYQHYMQNGKMNHVIVINSGYYFNDSHKAFQERILRNYNNRVLASQSVEDLVAHEMAHVMTFQSTATEGAWLLENKKLSKHCIPGVSAYADASGDGAETIAEAFVRMRNGETVPPEARELVFEYVERWRK